MIAVPRILIVEDNGDLSFGLRRSLEAEGYDIDVAGDGPNGIAAARRRPPDLVILDLMLPGIDGYEVTRRIKDDPALAAIPIIAVTLQRSL